MWFLCGIFLLVADVEVKGDGVFIRLRKEEVVCEDNVGAQEYDYAMSILHNDYRIN